jgi:hypothetical protein
MFPYRCIVRFLIWVIGRPQDLYTGHQQRKQADPYRCSEWGFEPTTPVAEQWNTVKLFVSVASAISSTIRTSSSTKCAVTLAQQLLYPGWIYANWQRMSEVVSEVWQVRHRQALHQAELTELKTKHTVISRLKKIIRSGMTFVSRNFR